MDVIEQLKQLGFNQYEAQAYVALLKENPLNGYELAKASGIPRPNIYPVLQKLEESGAVMRISAAEGTRYTPVPANELLEKLKRRYLQSLEAATTSLQQITPPPNFESVLNIRGYTELLDQARALLDQTEHHLLLSTWPEEALALAEPVQRAAQRGVQITTLCLRGCLHPCPACRGAIFRYAIAPAGNARWLVLVSDEGELLAGEVLSFGGSIAAPGGAVAGSSSASAVRTRQPMLVNLTGSYIQNSIALATILTTLGDRLFSEFDPQSLAELNHLHPFHTQGAWLEVMRQMLHL